MNARLKVGQDGVAHVYLEDGSELQGVRSIFIDEIVPGRQPCVSVTINRPFDLDITCEPTLEALPHGVTNVDKLVDVPEKGAPPSPPPPAEVEAVAQEEVSAPTPAPRSRKGRA